MGVKMPFGMRVAVGGPLMETHGVRKRSSEKIVVARGESFEDVAECVALRGGEFIDGGDVSSCQDHGLERPNGPIRYQRDEMFIASYGANGGGVFKSKVIAEQTRTF